MMVPNLPNLPSREASCSRLVAMGYSMSSFVLIAHDPVPKADPAQAPGGFFGGPLFMPVMIGMMVIFYLVVILPQSRRTKREQSQLMNSLKPGTKVITASGIVAIIVKAKDGEDELTVKSEDTKLRILRSSIVRVLGSEEVAETK